jgi:hypothetical protein
MAKNIRESVEVKEPDIWRPLADFLTEMIAKYADEMEFEKLPDPERFLTYRAVKEAYRIYTRKRKQRIARYIDLEFSMK